MLEAARLQEYFLFTKEATIVGWCGILFPLNGIGKVFVARL